MAVPLQQSEPDGGAETPPLLTVSQLTHAVKSKLEDEFHQVRLQGEVSNFKKQSSGHLYFSLKDAQAQISVVMFRGNASRLQLLPKDGDSVIVRGEMSVYAPRGNYQLIIRELSHAGVGELLLKLEQLKVMIHKRGWFRQEHKKPLPRFPKRIGIVTSPTGAAVRDVLNVLKRRHSGLHVLLNPVKVQGDGSAAEIAEAIHAFNAHNLVDVMIVGRGGGSIEDLWAFNEEVVAEAVFNSKIPVISAVGHETDHTICDYVADLRAPTPSAAAEIITQEKAQLEEALTLSHRRLQQVVGHLVKQARHRLEGVTRQPIFQQTDTLLGSHWQRLDDLRECIDGEMDQALREKKLQLQGRARQADALQPTRQILHQRQKLMQIENAIDSSWKSTLRASEQKVKGLIQTLQSIDPKNLLKKGYTIIFSEKDKSVITSVQQMDCEQRIRLLLADGQADVRVEKVTVNDDK